MSLAYCKPIRCRRLPTTFFDSDDDDYDRYQNDPESVGFEAQAKFAFDFTSLHFVDARAYIRLSYADKYDNQSVRLDRFTPFDPGFSSFILNVSPYDEGDRGKPYYLHFQDKDSINSAMSVMKMYYQGLSQYTDMMHSRHLSIRDERLSIVRQAEQASRTRFLTEERLKRDNEHLIKKAEDLIKKAEDEKKQLEREIQKQKDEKAALERQVSTLNEKHAKEKQQAQASAEKKVLHQLQGQIMKLKRKRIPDDEDDDDDDDYGEVPVRAHSRRRPSRSSRS